MTEIAMAYAIGTLQEFVAALKSQGWEEVLQGFLSFAEHHTPSHIPYIYEEDDRWIVWVVFYNEEGEGETSDTLKVTTGTGLWDDYTHLGSAMNCGGVFVEGFWVKPSGLVVCHSIDEPVEFPFNIPRKK